MDGGTRKRPPHRHRDVRMFDAYTDALIEAYMDPWRTPQGVLRAHLSNEGPHLIVSFRSTTAPPRLPAPIDPEAFAMPPHQGLGVDNANQLCGLRPWPQEPGEDQAVRLGKASPLRCGALEDLDLMP